MSQKPVLLLFDGHALVHRAFHALPPLTLPKTGEPTGAVYGFASMVLKALNELKPTHVAVAFDSAAPTFRHQKFEAYKAQRPRAPDELISQFRRVRELVRAFNIPTFEVDGYEADDLLGTLCQQASAQGVDTIIVTGDADTMQLVSPLVRVLVPKPGKTFSDTIIYDETKVKERYGVVPSQVTDLKGLKGDPSDNIPGVPGIGEKTATRLIQQFGTLEGVYAKIEEVTPPKIKEALSANEGAARLSKELTTIVTEVPITLDLAACRVSTYNREKVVQFFRELEFTSLLSKLPQAKEEKAPQEAIARDYCIVDTAESFGGLVSELFIAPSFAFDLETTGQDARKAELVGLSFSTTPGQAYYVPVGHKFGAQLPLQQVIDKLKPILEDSDTAKIAHNGKYDMTVLANYGVELHNLGFDTMIAAYLLGEKPLGLKALAFSKLNIEMTPISDLIGSGAKRGTMAEVPIPSAADYACADADMTGRLARIFEPELRKQGLWELFAEVEMPLVSVLLRMERNGVALNTDYLRGLSQSFGEQIAKVETQIYNAIGHQFNVNSPQQLATVLFDELNLRPERKPKKRSTEASVLEELKAAHPVVELVLEYRQLMKLKSTYVDALPTLINPKTGRVHTSFNQTQTATGRLSSSEPNLQNIPVGKQVRQAFVTQEQSLLLAADYSQIELRIMAHLSQDQRLMSAFLHDEDIHAQTASEVFGVAKEEVTPEMRRVAKTVNFGVIYGISGYGLEQATGLSREEASQFIDTYFEKYPGVKAYRESTIKEAEEKGYVQTILERRRYIPEINSSNRQVKGEAERMAVNMPVQGTAADIIKLAMIEIQRRMDSLGLKAKMLLQVHDELVFEVPEDELMEMRGLVLEVMPHALELSVPLKVDIKVGRNWGEME